MASLLGQSYTDVDDLFTQWTTFAVTNGWTLDQLDTGANRVALSKGTVFIQFEYASFPVKVYQSLAFDGTGTAPGAHTDDAGPTGGTANRQILINNSAGTADFFAGTENGGEYLVCVAEDAPDQFRMWMAGTLIKVGTWTGGEFFANQSWPIPSAFGPIPDAPFDSRNKMIFDAIQGEPGLGDTLHIEGVHSMTVDQKWGMVGNTADPRDDRAGEDRVRIGASCGRGGMNFSMLNWLQAQPNTGYVPHQPFSLWYREGAGWTLLGHVPGLRGLNITFFSPREEYTLGGDTWKVYPWVKKSSAGSGSPESGNNGLVFLK